MHDVGKRAKWKTETLNRNNKRENTKNAICQSHRLWRVRNQTISKPVWVSEKLKYMRSWMKRKKKQQNTVNPHSVVIEIDVRIGFHDYHLC